MHEEGRAPVFIDTKELEYLLNEKKVINSDLRVLNVTAYPDPQDGDPIMDHHKQHIPDSEYMDLRYLRDMSKPYPMMMPSEK